MEIHGKHYRRLIFLASQNLVQSEAPLVCAFFALSLILATVYALCTLEPMSTVYMVLSDDSEGNHQVIDLDDLACEHHEVCHLSLALIH